MEEQTKIKKKNNWVLPAIIATGTALFIFAIIAIVVMVMIVAGAGNSRYKKKVDLGSKYLSEMDYENAIACYEEAIAINPRKEEGYIGIANAYVARAEEYERYGMYELAETDYQNAIEWLNAGYDLVDSDEMLNRRTEISGLLFVMDDSANDLYYVDVVDRDEEETIGEESYEPSSEELELTNSDLGSASVGDTVNWGRYDQDDDESNGLEPIEWMVLEREGNKVLLISKYIIDYRQYHNEDDYDIVNTWATCSLRQWLNNEFVDAAFTQNEASKIATTHLENVSSDDFYVYVNAINDRYDYGADGGEDTDDKVFLLSYPELFKYFGSGTVLKDVRNDWIWQAGCASSSYMATAVSKYSSRNEIFGDSEYDQGKKDIGWPEECYGKESTSWWLRSPGQSPRDIMCVENGGGITVLYSSGGKPGYYENGIRPVMWVYTE